MHSPAALLIALTVLLNTPPSLAQLLHDDNPLLARLNLIGRVTQDPYPTSTTTTTTTTITPTTLTTTTITITTTITTTNTNTNTNTITTAIATSINNTTIKKRNDEDEDEDEDEDNNNACSSSYNALVDSIPTPTNQAALLAALSPFLATADAADPTMYCAVVTAIPDRGLRHDYQLWNAAMEDWCESHSAELEGLARDCVGGVGGVGGGGGEEGDEGGDGDDGGELLPLWATVDCSALSRYADSGCTGARPPVTLTSVERTDVLLARPTADSS